MASPNSAATLLAVDIGNSRIKLGRFDESGGAATDDDQRRLPEPSATVALPHDDAGRFDQKQLTAWCNAHLAGDARWLIGSVNRDTTGRFVAAVEELQSASGAGWTVRQLTQRDISLPSEVDQPLSVGIDRLLALFAVNRLRDPARAAIVVDMGSAITVDVLDARGTFVGGAILPGMGMSAHALEDQTDALPYVPVDELTRPPAALARSSIPAIESGVFWGTVGAVREMVSQLSAQLDAAAEVYLTGGSSPLVAEIMSVDSQPIVLLPHLVLAGIVLVDRECGEANA